MKSPLTNEPQSMIFLARLFAALDAIIVALYIPLLYRYATGSIIWTHVFALSLLTFLAVIVSAVLWWRQLPGRFLITYLLFPFRIVTAALSFAWLANFVLSIYPSTGFFHHVVWSTAIGIELVRLLTTVWLHRSSRVPSQILAPPPTTTVTVRDPYSPPSMS